MKPVLAVVLIAALLTPGVAAAQSNTPSLEGLVVRIVGFHEAGDVRWPVPARRELVAVECNFERLAREAQVLKVVSLATVPRPAPVAGGSDPG